VKRIEVAVKAKEDLDKANAQMEKILYSTSHDLRSPLTAIFGLVNLLRLEQPSETILAYADKIESSASRLDEIINDVIRFSRNSYQRLKSEKIFLEPLIWKIIEANLRPAKNLKRIKFDVLVEEDQTFYSDIERLEIIFNNVIRNAIAFSDNNKSRSFITIKANVANDEIMIDIIDNGIGIGKVHLNEIFKMFYRATDCSKGAGLGLYVAKEAVERLKGTIEVESEIGFGSMFRIRIPNDLRETC
jgi:signal transduction histidine kinase